jgi:hypothetical protein
MRVVCFLQVVCGSVFSDVPMLIAIVVDYLLPSPPHPQPAYPTNHPGGPFMEAMHLKKYSSVRVQTRKNPNQTIENGSQWSGSGFDDFVEPNHGSVLGSH